MEHQEFKDIKKTQLDEWRKEHPGAVMIEVELEEDNLSADAPKARYIAIPPNRNVLNALAKYAQSGNTGKANEVLLKNCILGGDMAHLDNKTDNSVFLSVLEQVGTLVERKKATIKKF